jgi:hypothetical protein
MGEIFGPEDIPLPRDNAREIDPVDHSQRTGHDLAELSIGGLELRLADANVVVIFFFEQAPVVRQHTLNRRLRLEGMRVIPQPILEQRARAHQHIPKPPGPLLAL